MCSAHRPPQIRPAMHHTRIGNAGNPANPTVPNTNGKMGSVSGLGSIRDGADVEGLDFLAPVENRLCGFRELGGSRHGDFTEMTM